MKKRILTAISSCLIILSSAQQREEPPPELPIKSLSDSFTTESIQSWQMLHTTEGTPNKIKNLSIQDGILSLQPYASGWYADYKAPFLYKNVAGNFDVRARIKVSGLNTSLPQSEWSLAGIMVREPHRHDEKWQPRTENWLFFTTGIAQPKNNPVFEVKTTNNSVSNLKLRPAREGWVELRIVRLGATFILMYRYEGEQWTILERFYRPLLTYELQVGINAYSGWNEIPNNLKEDPYLFNTTLSKEVPTDMLVQVDYVSFARPSLNRDKLNKMVKEGFGAPFYSPENILTDYSVTNEQIMGLFN
jgi:hypothetical protein